MVTNLIAKISLMAALTAAAVSAAPMEANISFPFRARNKTLSAGQYNVSRTTVGAFPVFALHNIKTHEHVFLMSRYSVSSQTADEKARLVFACNSAACGLTEIWTGERNGWVTAPPRYSAGEKERIVTVYLDKVSGE